MLIAHVTFTVANTDRDAALKMLLAESDTVRAMQGCITFQPFADPGNPGGIGIVHLWQTAADFAAYATSQSFQTSGATLRPLMTAPPVSRRFDATLLETVN